MFGDDLLEELTTALQEGYQSVGLCNPVIYFTRFWDGDDGGASPRVVAPGYSSIKQRGKVGQSSRVTPFEEFVCNACGTQCQLVGGACKVTGNLFICDGVEATWWEGGWVIQVRVWDRLGDSGEESVRQNLMQVGVGCR